MPQPLPWETWKANEPLSYLNTGLGILGLPGEYARGVIGSIPALFGRGPSHVGERLSGEELAQAFGWEKPGALGGMAMGLVTDPSMLAGPAIHLARSIAGGAQAAKAASTAAHHSVPFLKSAAFNIGAPLAGAAVYDANREYANPVADALASGLMAAPLATMGASMAMKGARGLGKALTPKDVPATQESIASRRNFMKQIGAGAASTAMEGSERLVGGASLKPRPVAPTETGPTLAQMQDAFERWNYSDNGQYPTVFEIAGREGMQHPKVGKSLHNISVLNDKLSRHMVELGDALDVLDFDKALAAYQKTQAIERVLGVNEAAAWDLLNKYAPELEALEQANRAADRARWNADRAASDAASRRFDYGLPWQKNPLVPYQPPSEGVLPKHPKDMTPTEYGEAVRTILSRVNAAEKPGNYTDLPPYLRQILDSGDWKAFSRARGYTEPEIADFQRWMDIAPPDHPLVYASDDQMHRAFLESAKTKELLPVGTPPLNQLAGQETLAPPATIPLPAPKYAPPFYSRLQLAAEALPGEALAQGIAERVQPGRKGRPSKTIQLPGGGVKEIAAQPDVPPKIIPGRSPYEQMVDWLHKGAPEGVSEQEIEHVLKQALSGQKEISVEDVKSAIRMNGLQVERKVLAENPLMHEQVRLRKDFETARQQYDKLATSEVPMPLRDKFNREFSGNPFSGLTSEQLQALQDERALAYGTRQDELSAARYRLDAAQSAYEAHPATKAAVRLADAERNLDALRMRRGVESARPFKPTQEDLAEIDASLKESGFTPGTADWKSAKKFVMEDYLSGEMALRRAEADHSDALKALQSLAGQDVPMYTNLLPPHGKNNPREVLLKVPNPHARQAEALYDELKAARPGEDLQAYIEPDAKLSSDPKIAAMQDAFDEYRLEERTWSHGHYPDEIGGRIIAEPRISDGVNPKGGKELQWHEAQSDLMQAGRIRGHSTEENRRLLAQYEDDMRDASSAYNGIPRTPKFAKLTGNELSEVMGNIRDKINAAKRGPVPNVPYKHNEWARLSLRHILDIAHKEGYDSIVLDGGDIVSRWATGGRGEPINLKAMRKFYDEILPQMMRDEGLDVKPVKIKIGDNVYKRWRAYLPKAEETPAGLTLTGKIARKGQPMLSMLPWMLPFAGASLASQQENQ
jgi:hypothetical protein